MDSERWISTVSAALSALANVALFVVAWTTYRWAKREFALTKPLKMVIRWRAMFFPIRKGEGGNVAMSLTIKGVTESPVMLHWIRYTIFDTLTLEDMKESEKSLGKPTVLHYGRRDAWPVEPLRIDYVPHSGIPVASVAVHYRMSWEGVNWRHEDWYRQFDIVGCDAGKVTVMENDPVRVAVCESSWWARFKDSLDKIRKDLGGGWQ